MFFLLSIRFQSRYLINVLNVYIIPCEKGSRAHCGMYPLLESNRRMLISWTQHSSCYCSQLANQPLNIATPGVRAGRHGSGGSLTCGLATQGPRSPERAPSVTNLASLNTHSPYHAAAASAKICTLLAGKYLQISFFVYKLHILQ